MSVSAAIWKPVATKLIDEMVAKHVKIDEYHLFSYVDQITDILATDQPNQLRNGFLKIDFIAFASYL